MKLLSSLPALKPETTDIPLKKTDPHLGLSAEEVKLRTEAGLANGLPESASKTEKDIVIEHLLTFFNLVFAALALVLLLVGSSAKNMTFLIVVICNIAIGIFQEIRAKRAVDKLTLVAAQQLRTLRDGKVEKIRSDLLVRDDIVEFTAGDQICADAVVCTGSLQANEALVTGEEDAIRKEPGDLLLSGSFVVAGSCRARLTAVGADSFAAKLALEAKADPSAAKSEMMTSLDKLIRVVGIALIPVGLLLFFHDLLMVKDSLRGSAEGTVAALVGMIPEGLYLLTSVAMAVSALKLAQRRVLVQDMNCIETLARVDVLCVDKTGTITEAVMEVDNVIPLTDDAPEHLEQVLTAFYAGTEPENDTGRAMTEMFGGTTDWICTQRIPFTSKTKWSAATFRDQGSFLIGAPEFILGQRYEELRDQVESWSARGCRVLLAAEYAGIPDPEQPLYPGRLKCLALILLTNRIRPEAPDTFAYFADQGVTIKVISGDNPITVSEVARRAGISGAERYIDVSSLPDEDAVMAAAETYTVFGRVTPDRKKLLIRSMKEHGHTVAMTGDGVNDVLAMKEADCGIAMASGAQAASQVAQLVLLNSDFAAMPGIVDEGRRVINNIQRAASLFLVKNIFSLGLAIITCFTTWSYPLMAIHLTLVSALTIGAPSFVLALEPNYERVRGKFLPTVLRQALPGGLTNIIAVLTAMALAAAFGADQQQIGTVCTAILATNGLLVLFETCKPFDLLRKILWALMAVGLVGAFCLLGWLFELYPFNGTTALMMLVMCVMTPTVFYAMRRIFDWGDRIFEDLRAKFQK